MPGLPRSALLVAWGNAWCAGSATLAAVVARVQRADEPHDVVWPAAGGLPDDQRGGLAAALESLRDDGMAGLRLALPVPGHPVGAVAGPGFAAAAVDAGEAALAVRRGSPERVVAGLVPAVHVFGPPGDQGHVVTWHVHQPRHEADAAPVVPRTSLAEADRELREALIDAAATLQSVAAGSTASRAELGQLLADVRSRRGDQALPDPYGPRAQEVAARAFRLLAIVGVAEDDDGSLTAHAAEVRRRTLDPLAHAARRALVAACDSVLEPARR